MAQPQSYVRQSDLTAYSRNNPAAPYNAALVDAEFNAVAVTLDETLANLALIQRDDGNLRMAIVTPDALDTATLNLIGSWSPRGPWLPSQSYAVRDMVTVSTTSYVCATAHTSSAFATDYALGYWQPVNGLGALPSPPSTIQFTTNDVILGRATAGAGPGEEIACTAAARSILDDATIADIRTTLGLGTGSNPTFGAIAGASLTLSALTANAFLYSGTAGLLTSTAAPTDGQLLIGDTGGAPVAATLTGTANQVVVTNGAGSIGLSLPQSIGLSSTPSFATVNLTNLSTGSVVFAGASSALSQDPLQFFWDETNNFLGIGTNAPDARLTVCGAVRFTDVIGNVGGIIRNNSFGTSMAVAYGNDTTVYGWDAASLFVAPTMFIGIASTAIFGVSPACDVKLFRDAAATPAIRDGVTAQTLRLYRTFTDASNYERLALQSGAGHFDIAAETAGTGTDDIDVNLVPAGTGCARVVAPNGVSANIKYATATVAAAAGATVTATNLIPDGAFLLGVVTRITVTLGNGGGTTGYQIGDGSDADRWGAIAARTAGTTSSNADATAAFTGSFIAANSVVLTAVGGNFDGTGTFRVTVMYIDLTPPTS